MRRLLLVTHRPIGQAGGPAARWRAFARYLPEHGWELDVLSATVRAGASEFDANASRAVSTRAVVMTQVGRLAKPMFGLAGVHPDSLPLSTLWIPRGALLLRRWIQERPPDVVLASGPPFAGPIAARLGIRAHIPLVVELRDLWAGNPAFDAGGRVLSMLEGWLLGKAQRVVACTPEAVSDLRLRHPLLRERVVEISNGFDPEIRSIVAPGPERDACDGKSHLPITLLHSGTLTPARPIMPIVKALQDPRVAGSFRLILHGYLSPSSRAEVERARRESNLSIEMLAPSRWEEAVGHIAQADAGLICQAHAAGDETAVASKVYEYLALGKPVLCITDGGASESLLRRLHADDLCARLDAPETIVSALMRLHDETVRQLSPDRLEPYSRRQLSPDRLEPYSRRQLSPDRLEPYSRRVLAGRMAALLEDVVRGEDVARGAHPG